MAKARGCGTRVAGGCYIETGQSPYGKPVEDFLIDPPIKVDPLELGVTPVGVKLIEKAGVWHVLDWVGSKHYPNVADFIEEVREMGLSRRVPETFDFAKLTTESTVILLHSRAVIDDWQQLDSLLHVAWFGCPKGLEEHACGLQDPALEEQCAAMWWLDVKEGTPIPRDGALAALQVSRPMPWGEYDAWDSGRQLDHSLGMFASFPITSVAVIHDPTGKTHEAAMNKAVAAGVPVNLERD